ncbi:ABC transporter ATP-binding protein [Rhodoferax ferrireducens]|uniref:ABC transporter ATP-binding protein n=1 Tax=Rhodoferax ferrireducens TaxID=192843 RepID=UPI000E0D2434|nr:ABC transporter ATP-binding protein [Rhodoferax ferrireducens]
MPAISFQSVSKSYPSPRGPKGSTFLALDRVSLDIEEGEFFGLLGPNGAGKTTMISILAGLSRANAGRVSVLGHDVQADYAQARRSLGVVPQELVFDPFFSVREALRIQSGYFGVKNNDAWIDELLESLGLADKAGANMRQLSGGMKRRVLVAQALVHKPPVIVLDEPTAGVDVELRQTLWQFIAKLNKQGSTVLLTTHYLEEAEALCGRIAMLKTGRIVALDHTSELLKAASSNVLRFKIDSELPKVLADKARITGRIVQFPAHDALEIEHYLAAVREAGLVAQDVEIRKADLEDVFLDVMKKSGQSGASPDAGPPQNEAAPADTGALTEAASVGVTS